MEKIAGGPEIADLLDLDRPLPETLALVAERKGTDIRDVMVVMLDRERHAGRDRPGPRSGRARAADHRRRCLRRDAGRARTRPSISSGGSAARRKASSRPRRSNASAVSCSAVCGRATTSERQAAMDAGYELGRVLTATTSFRATTLLLGHRGHRWRRAPRRPLPRGPRRHDRVAGDALPLGHRPADPGAARPPKLRALTGVDYRLTQASTGAEPGRLRLGQVERRERAQERVRHEHVDGGLSRLIHERLKPAAIAG